MMWESEAAKQKIPGLFKAILRTVNKSWIRYAEESPAQVRYMIFMLIVKLNSLLQGRHIINHFAFFFKELMLHLNIPTLEAQTAQIIFIFEIKNFYNVIAW